MAEAPAATRAPAAVKLDDLMLAMDVVDTLRHQDDFVARELDEEGREEALKARLRRIYAEQGIAVPDAVIDEGVKALKDSRFVYVAPKRGFRRSLALLWIGRRKAWIAIAAALAVAIALWGVWLVLRERPVESIRIERLTRLAPSPAGASEIHFEARS